MPSWAVIEKLMTVISESSRVILFILFDSNAQFRDYKSSTAANSQMHEINKKVDALLDKECFDWQAFGYKSFNYLSSK